MQNQEFSFQTKDNLRLFGQFWQPESSPKALICLVHGMGEHSGRYPYLVEFLNQNNYAVAAFDHRGHGRSEGKKGHTPTYKHLLEDVEIFLKECENLFPEIPKILYGHSMGGNVVLNFGLQKQTTVKGIIASAPFLKLAFEPPAYKIALGKVIHQIYPSFSLSTELEVAAISRDKNEVNAYIADAMVHDKITASFFLGIQQAAKYALANAADFELPLLAYHGTADRLTSPEGTKEFISKVKAGKVTFQLFENYYHELHNDSGKEQVFEWIKKWLENLLIS